MPGASTSATTSGIDFLLAPYRVLDLTDERGLLAGKILADLGADVIQIEPPGGSPARNIGPFHGDDPQPEKSLFWWAYAANKRSITLDLEQKGGQALLEKLVAEADFLIESFSSSAASSPSSARCCSGETWVSGRPGRWTPNTGTVRLSPVER